MNCSFKLLLWNKYIALQFNSYSMKLIFWFDQNGSYEVKYVQLKLRWESNCFDNYTYAGKNVDITEKPQPLLSYFKPSTWKNKTQHTNIIMGCRYWNSEKQVPTSLLWFPCNVSVMGKQCVSLLQQLTN